MEPSIDNLDLQTRQAIVIAWLNQNVQYARAHIKYAVAAKDGDRVRDWETWRAFSEHAIGELQVGALDLWLENMGVPDFDPTVVDDAESSFGEA